MQPFILPKNRSRDDALARIIRAIHELRPDRVYAVEIKERRAQRSEAQNNALWGVAYPPIMEHCGLRGERDREDLHEYWCGEYFGWVQYELLGKRKQRPRRTTTTDEDGRRSVLNKIEFMEFYDFIQQRAAEHHIVVPDPDPNYAETEDDAE